MLKLENQNLKELVASGVHLVDFFADWCGPCKMLMPVLEGISDKIDIIKVNVDEHQDLAMEYGVMSIPTLIVFKDGKIVKQMLGFRSKEQLIDEVEGI